VLARGRVAKEARVVMGGGWGGEHPYRRRGGGVRGMLAPNVKTGKGARR